MNPLWASKLPIDTIVLTALKYGVEPSLIMAICMQESGGQVWAQRYEPQYLYLDKPDVWAKTLGCSIVTEQIGQQTSYGLMQVMGGVLRERGFKSWFGAAFDPAINIDFGTKHFAHYLAIHKDPILAIASYNAGSPRRMKGDPSKFVNEQYVQSVLRFKAEVDGNPK